MTDKTKETAPPLIKQVWEFMQNQLEQNERKELTLGTLVILANDTTIHGFWRYHATGNLRTRNSYKILGFLRSCWPKNYIDEILSAGSLFSMTINLLLGLYLVFPRHLFNMGPAFMFSRSVETLRIDG